jgi:hypothetical protein
MKAVFDPIDRLLLVKPWWRRLLVMLPVGICFALIVVGLEHLPGHWKLLAPAFAMFFACLMCLRVEEVERERNRRISASNDGS